MVRAGGFLKMVDKDSKGITNVLETLKRGYETGDFSMLFPYLADSCEFDTMWRRLPIVGKDAVITYFSVKGNSIKKAKAFPECQYVAETDRTESKTCEVKYGLRLPQSPGGITNTVFAKVTVDKDGLANRILLVDPLFFDCAESSLIEIEPSIE